MVYLNRMFLALGLVALAITVAAYPPAVGILSNSKNCLTCHTDKGPWKDDGSVIIDVLDKETKVSLKQADGSFLIEAHRGQTKTVLTVIGCLKSSGVEMPYRNAWHYVDQSMIKTSSLTKFAPGWEVNLPLSCRLPGDSVPAFPDAHVSALSMTVRPTDAARDAVVALQVMLTKGESVKGKPAEGMIGNYFERTVQLRVLE